MTDKVYSVIVAYNDIGDFKNLLKNIGSQSFKCTKIIVIDNSDEYNKDYIKSECSQFAQNYNIQIDYYKSKRNLGSALGFSLGMQLSINENAEWVWLHDQDGYPDMDCLLKLIECSRNEKNDVIAPAVYDMNNNYLDYFRCNNNYFFNGIGAENKKRKNLIDVFGTAGVLISIDVMKKIGVYDGENFFVGYEDIEYSFRCLANECKILLLNDAIYRHPDLAKKYGYKHRKSIFRYIKPPYFSYVKNNDSFRNTKMVYSASYNFYRYTSKKIYFFNFMYSVVRTIISRIFDKDVNVVETLRLYKEGIKSAKSYKMNYKSSDICNYLVRYKI